LPERYGPPTTIYNRFNRWRKAGVWDRLMDVVTKAHDGNVRMIDTSIVRVHQQGATAKRGVEIDVWVAPAVGSRPKSMRSSINKGGRVRVKLTAGQESDIASAPAMLADLPKGAMLLADKGYDANALRAAVSTQDAWANIPPKTNRKDPICFSPYLYKARNLIERFFNKIKHYRRIATRYDKLAENYLAALKLVALRIWLRGNESTS